MSESYQFPETIGAMVGRRCCAAGYDDRAATRPYRLGNVPIIIGKWYQSSNLPMFTRGKCHFASGESSMIIIVLSIPQKESHDKIITVAKISNKSYKFKSGLKIKTL